MKFDARLNVEHFEINEMKKLLLHRNCITSIYQAEN